MAWKILMPYEFSANDRKGLDFIIGTYVDYPGVHVTLHYAYPPLPGIDVKANPEVKKMMTGMAYLQAELDEKENGLKTARAFLIEKGFDEHAVDYIFKKKTRNTADEIIETIRKHRYNVLVLSAKPGRMTQFFTRSIHNKVLSVLENVAVCIAT